MALFNYATKEITLKIVYYGPGLSGKTTNLQYLHSILNPESKGRLLSLSTEADRTLFFDFLPIELGKIRDFSIRFQLYTVPGQVRYNATRKVVLKGADAVIFVADSQRDMREQNVESFENMRDNLLANNINPDEVPVILQYNKRDLGNIASIEELNGDLNRRQYHVVEASAISGAGVDDSFRLITRLLLKHISKKHRIEIQPPKEKERVSPELPFSQEKEIAVEEVVARSTVTPAASLTAPTFGAEKVQELWPQKEVEEVKEKDIPRPAPEIVQAAKEPKDDVFPVTEREPEKREAAEEVSLIVEEADRPFPAGAEPEKVAAPQIGGLPQAPGDKIERIIEEMSNINGMLTDLKNSIYVLSREMGDLRETRKGQEETNRILQEISALFQRLQTKKSWFRF